jgi:hypothetical protein
MEAVSPYDEREIRVQGWMRTWAPHAATHASSNTLGASDLISTLDFGTLADLLVVRADPASEPNDIHDSATIGEGALRVFRHFVNRPWFTSLLAVAWSGLAVLAGVDAASVYRRDAWSRETLQQTALAVLAAAAAAGWLLRFGWEVRRNRRRRNAP